MWVRVIYYIYIRLSYIEKAPPCPHRRFHYAVVQLVCRVFLDDYSGLRQMISLESQWNCLKANAGEYQDLRHATIGQVFHGLTEDGVRGIFLRILRGFSVSLRT